jgi:hypothetical protein
MRKFEHDSSRFLAIRRGLRRPVCIFLLGVFLGLVSLVGLLLGSRTGSSEHLDPYGSGQELEHARPSAVSDALEPFANPKIPRKQPVNPVIQKRRKRSNSAVNPGVKSRVNSEVSGQEVSTVVQETARIPQIVKTVRTCHKNCTGHGTCNHVFGECRCVIGWKGEDCGVRDLRRCNEKPHQKSASLCDGSCDDERALCYCNGTHPHRPLPMQVRVFM